MQASNKQASVPWQGIATAQGQQLGVARGGAQRHGLQRCVEGRGRDQGGDCIKVWAPACVRRLGERRLSARM